MHEIVTLQIGQQSNYLATHFWNIQESYFTYAGDEESPVDHDVHFRQGVGADGSDTFTPRTVIYDFKAGFGTLKRINELYETFGGGEAQQQSLWGGTTTTERLPQIQQIAYQRSLNEGSSPPPLSTDTVRYWSDFNRVYYHPKSLVQVYETDVDPQRRSFDQWGTGVDLFATLDAEHELFDRDVRPFVEECDQLQGLQVIAGLEGGWAGFTARYMERLRDEFGKVAVWVWAVGEGGADSYTRRFHKDVNEARALHEISTLASMYIPMSGKPSNLPGYVSLNTNSPWHTSALQSCAYESLMLPSRLRSSGASTSASLDALAACISPAGDRRIAELEMEIIGAESIGAEALGTLQSSAKVCNFFPHFFTPAATQRTRTFAELETFRGKVVESGMFDNGYHDDSGDEHEYRRFQSALPFPLIDSFPHIYSPGNTNTTGDISVRARLKSSSAIASTIRALERVTRMRVDVEEREELSNGLLEIAGAYTVEFESEDEEGWDD